MDRTASAVQRVLYALLPELRFAGFHDYILVSQDGELLTMSPADASAGMPDPVIAKTRASVAGFSAVLRPGTRLVVGFLGMSESRPFVAFVDEPDAPGGRPTSSVLDAVDTIDLADALGVVIRDGDAVTIGATAGIIHTTGQGVPLKKSRVRA